MNTGKVKFFDSKKGYGFIIEDETEEEIFFHVSKVVHTVKDGDFVSFTIGQGKKGKVAENVKLIG